MRLLNGSVGPALADALGWSAPPPPNVLAVQLLELGRLHPQAHEEVRLHT